MRRRPAVLAAVAAALLVCLPGLVGCAKESHPAASESLSGTTTPPAVAAPAPESLLPAPEALTDVLYRLSDTSVPGDQKVPLVEGATNDDAAELDRFGKALADSGYMPIEYIAENIAWATSPAGNVTADVTVKSQNPNASNPFTFPMEFKPSDPGWQLSRRTADILLTFNQNPATPTPTG